MSRQHTPSYSCVNICVDETSDSQEDGSDADHVGLEAYIPTEKLKKLREQNVVPGASRGRPSKRPRNTGCSRKEPLSSPEERRYGDVEDVFVLDDDEGEAIGSLPSRDLERRERRPADDDDDTRMLLQTCLQDDDYAEDDDGALSEEGDELDVFRLTQRVPLPEEPETDKAEVSGDGQEDMIELRFVDQNRHEFSTRAFIESTFKYPCSKFVDHAKMQGWIADGEKNIAKYVFDGDIVDIDKQTPNDFGMEDGDTVDVYYYEK